MKTNKGFTMLEMLAVMAILGIIASFGIVYMQSSLESTEIAACQNKLELVATAEKRFFATQNRHSIEFENLESIDSSSELVDKGYLDFSSEERFSINVEIDSEDPTIYRLSCSEYPDTFILQSEDEYRKDYLISYTDIDEEGELPQDGDEDDIDVIQDYEEDLSELDLIWTPTDGYPVSIGFDENHYYLEGTILYFEEPITIGGVTYESGIYEALKDTSEKPIDTNVTTDPTYETTEADPITWLMVQSDSLEDTNAQDISFYIVPEEQGNVTVPSGNSFIMGHDNGVYIDASSDSTANYNNNFISGGDVDDILIGGERDDMILGQEGNDFIDGGIPRNKTTVDTAVFAYPMNEYTLEIVPVYDGYITIDFKGDPIDLFIYDVDDKKSDYTLYRITHPIEGEDYLVRIHELYFAEGTISMEDAYLAIGQ
ncbi:MAG: prepilin-type N-terminal cleavage/methylation domain-containing protein [Clostridia bacterium]